MPTNDIVGCLHKLFASRSTALVGYKNPKEILRNVYHLLIDDTLTRPLCPHI